MNKLKYIVKFQAHDENELVVAYNEEHAKVIAQHKCIQMGIYENKIV